ncbi:hypothetical protein bcgnr5372_38160 [Bacillus luti]|nr:hypothetical protein [Bacillus cereus]HDR8327201.1 hypothetical protein [Bacillus cereus]HDR8336391.1 hypothetical protein [Bacillus cereus]
MTFKTKKSNAALNDLFSEGQMGLFTDGNGVTINPDFIFNAEEIAEKIEVVNVLAEIPKGLTDLNILQKGDKIHLRSSRNGREVTGYYVTKGFHDGRDKNKFQYYYMEVANTESPTEFTREFLEFTTLDQVSLLETKENSGYIPQKKEETAQLLMEKIQKVPLEERFEVYKKFQNGYAWVSREWHDLLGDAWAEALVKVTTDEEYFEFLEKRNKQREHKKMPKLIQKELERVFNEAAPGDRLQHVVNTRWIELLDDKNDYEKGHEYYFWEKTTGDCFKHLALKYLESTNDSKIFFGILKQLRLNYKTLAKGDFKNAYATVSDGDVQLLHPDEVIVPTFIPLFYREKRIAS